jgi:hypothetical protein
VYRLNLQLFPLSERLDDCDERGEHTEKVLNPNKVPGMRRR